MFEITGDDLAALTDEQLRALVGRLCEAEVRKRSYSAASVTSGGSQDAADGGIDVRVALPMGSAIDGFVARTATGFQVKKQDMPPAEINKEMRPNGALRPSIQALADQGGAYILVSSAGSTTDSALAKRRAAMTAALAGSPNAGQLELRFYDRHQLASWVRSHEALIPWVRGLVGRPIIGWQSYGPWAAPVDDEFLVEDTLRIHPGRKETERGISALDGIQTVREQLRIPRRAVRLVGLSGVGKSRLVQALFDERVGEHALDPSLAIYANMSDELDPQPIGLASQLIATGTRVILIIDNCPPSLHHRLVEVCRRDDSELSLLTVEYDICDDEPEGTDVFILDSSSPELIERLVHRRFPKVSDIDARTIAESSGGNARVALALAATVEHQGRVAGLADEELFRRLFHQRQQPDENLYLIAQVCALVYSLEGEDIAETGELALLGKCMGKTAEEVYRALAELRRRDLVQQRGVWRAILPHAVANRLAAVGLQNIPYARIDEQLVRNSARLLKSFSRRLSYLHTSADAVAIVKRWLSPKGLIGDVARLNELGHALFKNSAPVAPEDALAALERAFTGIAVEAGTHPGESHLGLLRSLAYDAALFERCVQLMADIAVAGEVSQRAHATSVLVSMFHLHLSGTHASIEQRLGVITNLLASSDAKRQALGVLALRAVLEGEHFFSSGSFEFGARSRDYGFSPRTRGDVQHWYGETLQVVRTFGTVEKGIAFPVRAALAETFRGIWHMGCVADELVQTCHALRQAKFWPEGWLAVRQALGFDGKAMDAALLERLIELESALRPVDVQQRVRSIVFSTSGMADFEDYDEGDGVDFVARIAKVEELSQELGKVVATDESALEDLLPEVVSAKGRLWQFGVGLFEGASDAKTIWCRLVNAFSDIGEQSRQPLVLRGFLHALNLKDPGLASKLLDKAVEHETLATCYLSLQTSVPITERDVLRIKRALTLGKSPAWEFRYLAFGRATDSIPAEDLREIVLAIAAKENGHDVAIEILDARLHSVTERKEEIDLELVEAGCALLRQISFAGNNNLRDYQVGEIAKACLRGPQGVEVVQDLCAKFKVAVTTNETRAFCHDDLLHGFFVAQPIMTLDGLCGGDAEGLEMGICMLDDARRRKNLLAAVSDEDLTTWCDQDPIRRYPAIAGVIAVADRAKKDAPYQWTSRARLLLENAPNAAEVLRALVRQFYPDSGWSGSLAAILESHMPLLEELSAVHSLSGAIAQEKTRLSQAIARERAIETAEDRQRGQRFE